MSNTHSSINTKEKRLFLTILCFVPQKKDTDMEHIFQFLQQYGINFKRFNKLNNHRLFYSIPNNANYMGQNEKPILAEHLELIHRFLSSKLIIVAFFYHKQFLNPARLVPSFIFEPVDTIWTQSQKFFF